MARQSHNTQFTEDGLYRLGLVHQPFGDSIPAYEDTTHATQLNVAISLLQGGERVLLIRGEAGLGKTTFLNQIARQDVPVMKPVLVPGTSEIDLETLCAELAMTEEGPSAAPPDLDRAINHIRGSRRAGNRPALLIDDAHRLPPRTVRDLLELWMELCDKGEGFGLVLALDPDRDQPWSGSRPERLPKGRVHVINLYPLTESQTADYLEHRLTAAGADSGLLGNAEKKVIHERSAGHPHRIHEAAFEMLAERLAERQDDLPSANPVSLKKRRRGGALARMGAAAGIGAVVAGGGAAWYLLVHFDPQPPTPALDIADQSPSAQQSADEESGAPGTGDNDPLPPPADKNSPFGLVLPQRYTFTRDTPPERLAEAPVEEEAIEHIEPSPVADATVEEAERPQPAADDTEAADETEDVLPGHQWVRSQDGSRLTVQLLAASNPDTLVSYAARHGMREQTELVRTERQGEDWYLLLYGSHESRAEARSAIDRLSLELREQGPWVRSLASVQQTLTD